MSLFATLSINDIQRKSKLCYAECHYSERSEYLNVMLSVFMLNVDMLRVVMLNVVILSVVAPMFTCSKPFHPSLIFLG
jgi:hypothetical protein